jgi:hypothetical protein
MISLKEFAENLRSDKIDGKAASDYFRNGSALEKGIRTQSLTLTPAIAFAQRLIEGKIDLSAVRKHIERVDTPSQTSSLEK